MSFSAFNIGSKMIMLTGNKIPQLRLATKPVAGGTFTPNTLEAAFVMRSNLDYQFESAFLTKYKALMQNRLNFLQEKLKDAYTNLLNTSMGQQVGQDAAIDTRADVRLDGFDSSANAKVIGGVKSANGFEDMAINPNSDSAYESGASSDIWCAPGLLGDGMATNGIWPEDLLNGWSRALTTTSSALPPAQFRPLLENTTAAGNVQGEMKITMRAEDDPPEPVPYNGAANALVLITSAVTGAPAPPTYYNQKLEEHTTEYKTGGFWSTVNYLYNFAPRQLKYSYALGYTVNSDEAGNDAYLASGLLVDSRDNVGGGNTAFLQKNSRVQWASFEPTEGYQHEISGTSSRYSTVINRQKVWVQSENEYGADVWYNAGNFDTSNAGARAQIVDGVLFQSGTYTYDGQFMYNQAVGLQANGNNGVAYANSNIQEGTTFKQVVDWTPGRVIDATSGNPNFDVTQRGLINSSLFFNHYEVETRTVDFNSDSRDDSISVYGEDNTGQLMVTGGISRSFSVNASKDYQWLNENGTPKISRGAGNVSKTFNGEFVQGQHKIESFNGLNIAGNESKQASPVMGNFQIGAYEGILRSYQMSRNIVDYTPPEKTEINAADTVPTDWYQAEMLATNTGQLATGKIWMPWVASTIYSGASNGTEPGYGKSGGKDMVVQARNTFTLKKEDFLQFTGFVPDATGFYQPVYNKKDFLIDVNLTGIHHDSAVSTNYLRSGTDTSVVPNRLDYGINLEDTKIFVNGELLVPPSEQPPGTPIPGLPDPQISVTSLSSNGASNYNLGLRVNLKDYLREGMNTLVIQTRDATYSAAVPNNSNEGISVVAAAGNATEVAAILNNKVITGYNSVGETKYNPEFTREGILKAQSRWQTRAVPHTVSPNLAVDPLSDFLGINGVTQDEINANARATIANKVRSLSPINSQFQLFSRLATLASGQETTGSTAKVSNAFVQQILDFINQQKYRDIFRMGMMSNLNKLYIQGSANLPTGSSLQGNISMYYDQKKQMIVVNQDKLVGKS